MVGGANPPSIIKMKIGLLTVSHHRPHIDKCYCLMVERLMRDYPGLFLPVAVVSEAEEMITFEDSGIETYQYKNNPVGEKHNFILNKLRGRVTHVLHLGSDNIIDNRFIDELLKGADCDIAWGRGIVFYSVRLKVARYWDSPYKVTAGPDKLISAELLDRVDWHIWDDTKDSSLDHSAFATLEPHIKTKYTFMARELGAMLVDIKSDVNINSFNQFCNCGTEIGVNYIYKKISTEESEYLKTLN
jgi:hypothetical protein